MRTEDERNRAVISAYYGRVVSRGETLRGRIQGAYATISTFAGGLIGVGLLTNLPSFSQGVRVWGLIATGTWILVAFGFVLATSSVSVPTPASRIPDDTNLSVEILKQVNYEQETLKRRTRAIFIFVMVPVVATVMTIILAVHQFPTDSLQDVRIQLSPSGVELLAEQCGIPSSNVVVVDIRGLMSMADFLDITIIEGPSQGCHLLLPKTSMVGINLDSLS